MITYLGSLSIGGVLPGAAAATVAGMAGINAALPDILARLDALAAFAPQPVSFSAQLGLANQMVTSVQAAISLGLPIPSIAAQLAIVGALVSDLLAAVSSVNAQLEILADFELLLGTAGVHAYAYAGDTGDLGAEFASELSGGTPGGAAGDAANALVLITTIPAVWAAMGEVFQVTP
jgi:hypothetical protein